MLNILVKDEKPHILCITETWCNPSISNAMLNIDNYFIDDDLRCDRYDTAGGIGGGLLVYVRNDIVVKALPKVSKFNQYCKFQLLSFNDYDPLTITLVYRSPNSSDDNTMLLADLVDNCEKKSLIIGDFNLPNMNISSDISDKKGRPVLDAINRRFLENSVQFPTHIRGNILDL